MKDKQGIELLVGDRVAYLHWREETNGQLAIDTITKVTPESITISNTDIRTKSQNIVLIPDTEEASPSEDVLCKVCKRKHEKDWIYERCFCTEYGEEIHCKIVRKKTTLEMTSSD